MCPYLCVFCSSTSNTSFQKHFSFLLFYVSSFLLFAFRKSFRLRNMANSRVARFVMEVAPPQFVSVMRHRTAKILDTIIEDEKDVNGSGSGSNCFPSTSKSFSSAAASCSMVSTPSASASAVADSKYFLRRVQVEVEVQRSFSIFEN